MARFPADWFHGSALRLTILKASSTMTPVYDLAGVFACKPGLFVLDGESGELSLWHNGAQDGRLYQVVEVGEEDITKWLQS